VEARVLLSPPEGGFVVVVVVLVVLVVVVVVVTPVSLVVLLSSVVDLLISVVGFGSPPVTPEGFPLGLGRSQSYLGRMPVKFLNLDLRDTPSRY
jgi:hypothetical protein